jgi:hypothetical protein
MSRCGGCRLPLSAPLAYRPFLDPAARRLSQSIALVAWHPFPGSVDAIGRL